MTKIVEGAIGSVQNILGLVVVRPNVGAVDVVLALHLANDDFRVAPHIKPVTTDVIVLQVGQTVDEALVLGLVVRHAVPQVVSAACNRLRGRREEARARGVNERNGNGDKLHLQKKHTRLTL